MDVARPPVVVVLIALVMIALGESSGAVMSQLRREVGAYARVRIAARALFFSALAKDLVTEAEAKVADAKTPLETRVTAATKFLEAIWRYWSLVDFVVSQRDVKSAAAMRLAFEDAEGNTKGASAPGAVNPCSARRPPPAREAGTPDPDRLRASFARIARVLGVVQHLTPLATKPPA